MKAFALSVIVAVALAVGASLILSNYQMSTETAYTTSGTRLNEAAN